ncbi:hypothetical protein NDU88_002775 [Pleurodeles waltl]|uniref:Uncharacterized protein n=1 Tax=Pleurodeles waltl TaxID=8319 RepID=A0AAV7T4C3_PLEWA|nr:hypothetical protein NDU88_002775 [Pleurodeles waltl]
MIRNKGQLPQQNNKMDKYVVLKQAGGSTTLEEAGWGQAMERALPSEPTLGSIIAAIQDLKGTMEPKLEAVTVDVTLLRADLKKVVEKSQLWSGILPT